MLKLIHEFGRVARQRLGQMMIDESPGWVALVGIVNEYAPRPTGPKQIERELDSAESFGAVDHDDGVRLDPIGEQRARVAVVKLDIRSISQSGFGDGGVGVIAEELHAADACGGIHQRQDVGGLAASASRFKDQRVEVGPDGGVEEEHLTV
ncbi:MAG: hypothetical protein CMJ49_09250 [Planctomycetaceae bacterium]|nr:hypothetical protein [Planctomycetaceae bacterium]